MGARNSSNDECAHSLKIRGETQRTAKKKRSPIDRWRWPNFSISLCFHAEAFVPQPNICYSFLMDSIKMAYGDVSAFSIGIGIGISPLFFFTSNFFYLVSASSAIKMSPFATMKGNVRSLSPDSRNQTMSDAHNSNGTRLVTGKCDDGLIVIRLKLIYCRHEPKNVVN